MKDDVDIKSKGLIEEVKRYIIHGWNYVGVSKNDKELIKLRVKAKNDKEALIKAKRLATRDNYNIVEIREI